MLSYRKTSEVGELIANPPTLTQDEKIMTALTPIFAVLAGYVATVVARYFPGIQIPKSQLIVAFVVGAGAVLFLTLKVLHSNDKRIVADAGRLLPLVSSEISSLPEGASVLALLDEHKAAWEATLESHKAAWEAEVLGKMPPVVAQSLRNLANQSTDDASAPVAPAVA